MDYLFVVIGYLFVVIAIITVVSITTLVVLVALHRREIVRMDEITIGRPVVIDHFLYQGMRATNYGFACTFDVLARRTHPDVDFSQIPEELKRPFRLMCRLLLIGLAGMFAGSIWAQFV